MHSTYFLCFRPFDPIAISVHLNPLKLKNRTSHVKVFHCQVRRGSYNDLVTVNLVLVVLDLCRLGVDLMCWLSVDLFATFLSSGECNPGRGGSLPVAFRFCLCNLCLQCCSSNELCPDVSCSCSLGMCGFYYLPHFS
jgi:hypothetical protein